MKGTLQTIQHFARWLLRRAARDRLATAFFLVAIAAGIAMSLFAAWHVARPVTLPGDGEWNQMAAADRCLAQAIYFEARGEPYEGRMAVAQVVHNRVRDSRYPNEICAVVFQGADRHNRCQFSFACDGKSDRPRDPVAWQSAVHLAQLVNAGHLRDLTGRATHYHADYVTPRWSKSQQPTRTIGRHRFYRGEQ